MPLPTDRAGPNAVFDAVEAAPFPAASPILVAVAADECTPAAVTVTEALASQRGAVPTLLYVMELFPSGTFEGGLGVSAAADEFLDPASLTCDEVALRAACGAGAGVPATWPFEIELGQSAATIIARAHGIGAKLIVMGMHHHGTVDRVLGADTLRAVMALGGIPVLGVRPTLTTLPRSVLVAMDFSGASLRAARLARELMDASGTMYLVFVDPMAGGPVSEATARERLIREHGIDATFAKVIRALDPPPGMTIIPVRRGGTPIAELIASCELLQPDLVAVGSQRHPWLERLRLGSVAAALARDSRWSLLVTPPAPADSAGGMSRHIARTPVG